MKVYLFSGLGADERLFQKLKPVPGYEYVPLPYVHPGNSEALADYAALLVEAYRFETPCIFGGVSIGGMIAQEIAQIVRPEKLLLISTLQFRSELPGVFKLGDNKFTKSLLSKPLLDAAASLGDKFTVKSKEGRKLFYDMLRDSEADFMKFGFGVVLGWQPPKAQVPVIRIHGNKDRVFPLSRIKECIKIKGGNHFMVYEKGEEIGEILRGEL
ncbi:alpha/beta hydrolase [Cryomorpha ignava]|uniref:Alpha/beta hydrolase n=1 Tax=Cryomorpha ignava TaxID=101383 RepID=A0A7K3WWA7_9FLAO|nr:alpha/beta hydrolase [Cryomorpha ignava]NEN25212.1 alpha/beta hydrolase [Cryomorpha ignava]